MSNEYKIALLDGDGVFANLEFWKNYFSIIGVDFQETVNDLDLLISESSKHFPKSVCVNSKFRLRNAVLLHNKVTHFLLFLRKDKYVNNCPASVYRIRWIKEKFPNVKTIVWPYDLDKNASPTENLINLAKHFTKPDKYLINILKNMPIPKREPVYTFPTGNKKEKALLIGVVPHSIDPFRKTDLMDFITSIFNIYSPVNFNSSDILLAERSIDDTIYFKEKAIFHAIEQAPSEGIKKFILVSDPLDLPGTFTFPIIKEIFRRNQIHMFDPILPPKEKSYVDLVVSHKNHAKIKNILADLARSHE